MKHGLIKVRPNGHRGSRLVLFHLYRGYADGPSEELRLTVTGERGVENLPQQQSAIRTDDPVTNLGQRALQRRPNAGGKSVR